MTASGDATTRLAKDVRRTVVESRREHSTKPEGVRESWTALCLDHISSNLPAKPSHINIPWGEDFMQWKQVPSGVTAVLLICRPVMAQSVPVLSGKYATTYNEICQAGTNTNYSAGATYNQILVADFDSVTRTVKVTGTSVYGALVAVSGAPARLKQTPINTSYPYSNTATTITIGSHTFNALYGPLMLGMPQWAIFGGISSGGCSASAVAIRQSPLSVSIPDR